MLHRGQASRKGQQLMSQWRHSQRHFPHVSCLPIPGITRHELPVAQVCAGRVLAPFKAFSDASCGSLVKVQDEDRVLPVMAALGQVPLGDTERGGGVTPAVCPSRFMYNHTMEGHQPLVLLDSVVGGGDATLWGGA